MRRDVSKPVVGRDASPRRPVAGGNIGARGGKPRLTPDASARRPYLRRFAPTFILAVFLALSAAATARGEEKSPWSRIVVIGASVSHGFTVAEPLGSGPLTQELALDRYLNAALLAPHDPPVTFANAMFFMVPDDMGHTQVRAGLTNNPTLVIGIDFLFWFCYGRGVTDDGRLEHFEKGLKMLESFSCPVVVGDIPDASEAVNRMLSPREVPSPKARAVANRRLAEWAALHKNVTVVPVSEFMRKLAADEPIKLHGRVLPAGTTHALLQGDRLHTNARGCAALAVSILDEFIEAQYPRHFADVVTDPAEVLERVRKR